MRKFFSNQIIAIILVFVLILTLAGCDLAYSWFAPTAANQNALPNTAEPDTTVETTFSEPQETAPDENGCYTSTYEVAAYLNTFQKLPSNYITKKDASDLGWESDKGNLWEVTDELSIGGDIFGNREGLLPKKQGRVWYECDVNYSGGYRGAERIVFSNDGLIYFTEDHYATFVQLY